MPYIREATSLTGPTPLGLSPFLSSYKLAAKLFSLYGLWTHASSPSPPTLKRAGGRKERKRACARG
eukprot:1624588-Pyramimonas_sp.AAC.1